MNELKPEDVMPEGAVVEALEIRAPHDAVCRYAIDLLREKDAEIERLKKANQNFAELENGYIVTGYKNIRAEAITEFAKELTSELIRGGIYPVFVKGAIERTDKKLKGETDGETDL